MRDIHVRRRKKMDKIDIFAFGSLGLVKGQWNLYSRFSNRRAKKSTCTVVCRHFVLLCFVFLGADPIPYEQAAILNLLYFLIKHTILPPLAYMSG